MLPLSIFDKEKEEFIGPTKLVLSPKQKYSTLDDDFTVRYEKNGTSSYDVGSVQTDRPFRSMKRVGYFEVEVINVGRTGAIAIGVSEKGFLVTSQPGWKEDNSYAWHCDDGHKFHHNGRGEPYGTPSGKGDIIGLCVDFYQQLIFFTKNGKNQGIAWRNVQGTFYPTIGTHSRDEIARINLKGPFKFNIKEYIKDQKEKETQLIDQIIMNSGFIHSLICNYLIYKGNMETLKKMGYSLQEKEDHQFNIRAIILSKIAEGEISQTLLLIQQNFPNLLLSPQSFESEVEKVQNNENQNQNQIENKEMEIQKEKNRMEQMEIEIENENENQIEKRKIILSHEIMQKYSFTIKILCQNMIELIKQNKFQEAFTFSQNKILPFYEIEKKYTLSFYKDFIEQVFGLVAYSNPLVSPSNFLIKKRMRKELIELTNKLILQQFNFVSENPLKKVLKHLICTYYQNRNIKLNRKGEILKLDF
ncbi:ran-binding protein m [Anaeramoeba ignava]|uniref:Ran-binding protein m n=1 Tax=Anaeramoeba ignava TaxID=1746090 RepID=A0A9Q0LSC8_ANAIG|nr:ran-binding protein m [Anaeramoeba ignava]